MRAARAASSTTRYIVASLHGDAAAARRPGYSLAELLAVVAIAALLGSVLVSTFIAQLRLARAAADRVLDADAVRTASGVLAGELRRATPADVRALTGDSISIRAFRGTAIVCTVMSDLVTARYRGDRLPDPPKDSVLVIGADGGVGQAAVVDARAVSAEGCTPLAGETVLALRLALPPPSPAVLLMFESGRYYLTARALRYRLGSEGRQPLTAEAFHHPGTRFLETASPRQLDFDLAVDESIPPRRHRAPFAPPPHRGHD